MEYVFRNPVYRVIIPILDIIGKIFFSPLKLFKKRVPSNPKRILIVRLDHIGDFVCTTPMIKNIKKKFPDAKITVLVNSISKDLAYRNPDIDKIITFSPFYLGRGLESSNMKGLLRVARDVKNIGFDLGLDPRGDLVSIFIMWLGNVKYRAGYGITGGGFLLDREARYDKNSHIIDRNLSLLKELNIPIEDKTPAVYFNDKDALMLHTMIDGLKINKDKAVVLHPFAGAKAKEWPKSNFQDLIDRLKKDGWDILLVGSERDKASFNNIIDTRGKLNLPQLACLIKSIGFFIGLDSGPANIAAALNVPSVIICSGTNIPQLWIPDNVNVRLIYRDTGCKPCENKICLKERSNSCITSISVDDVIKAVKGLGR